VRRVSKETVLRKEKIIGNSNEKIIMAIHDTNNKSSLKKKKILLHKGKIIVAIFNANNKSPIQKKCERVLRRLFHRMIL